MKEKMSNWIKDNEYLFLVILVLIFILIRLPGTGLPLHQDEYKWPMIVNPANASETSIPHPPLSQYIYKTAGQLVGFNENFRFVPLFFGSINLVLLYFLIRMMLGRKEALIASIIWIFSYFSVLASLMVDTDGQIMPFFFLLALLSYYKLYYFPDDKKYFWAGLLIISLISGFFIKVSFFLAIAAIIADFLWSKKHMLSKKLLLKYSLIFISSIGGLAVLLFLATFVFPFFNLSSSFEYWKHFFVLDRGWFQTLIQCIKAILYSSPLLILIPFLGSKNNFSKARLFLFFIFFSFIFYVVLFDFSIGALDRYLQLLVLPLTVISTIVISSIFDGDKRRFREFFYLGLLVSFVLILLQSLPHYVPPLHPKADWIDRVMSLRWNFVYPFSGGSGPLGFYVSFLFIALSWLITAGLVLLARFKSDYKKLILVLIIPIAFTYNFVFIEEYLIGHWNGHAPKLLYDAILYIKNNPEIKMVTAYNDNGGNEIQQIGKYRKRLYIDPKFDDALKVDNLNKYKEHYFVLSIPKLQKDTVYEKYFNSCKIIYEETDKKMSATIYDCGEAPFLEI